jgi:hypothetical protein
MNADTSSEIPADGSRSVRLYANLFAYRRTFSRILKKKCFSGSLWTLGPERNRWGIAGFYLAFGRMRLK